MPCRICAASANINAINAGGMLVDPLPFMLDLEKKHFDEIGFIPKPRLEQYRDRGQIWVASENDESCGFLVWGRGAHWAAYQQGRV